MKTKRKLVKYLVSLIILVFYRFNTKAKENKINTKVLSDKIFFKHKISKDHPETPDRIKYIINYLNKSKLNHLIENVDINSGNIIENWIKEIHSNNHIKNIKEMEPLAHKVSSAAVEICIKGVDMIFNSDVRNIFCAVRPPGHHALNTGKEEGFCYYNHVAITAKYIQKKYLIDRILIVDWDYHHGNSTEYFFYDDPSVLFFSSHDQYAYPGTGSPLKKGKNRGLGYNINVHLPCNTTDKEIIDVYKKKLLPIVKKFKPEFILISAGFDSRVDDPLGCYKVTDNGFSELTKIVLNIANKFCDGKILSILEGGYNLDGNASAAIAHIKELNKKI